jgi:uncharacterized protein YegL
MELKVLSEFDVYHTDADAEAWILAQVSAPIPAQPQRHPLCVYVLLDCSGSMRDEGKMDMAIKVLNLLVTHADARDRLALITFNGDAKLALPLTAPLGAENESAERNQVRQLLDDIVANGGTNIEAALRLAASTIRANASHADAPDTVHMALLLTDGAPQMGLCLDTPGERALLEGIWSDSRVPAALYTFGLGEDHEADFLAKLASSSDIGCEVGAVLGNAGAQITDHQGATLTVPHALEIGSSLRHTTSDDGSGSTMIHLPVFCPGYALDIPIRVRLGAHPSSSNCVCLSYRSLGTANVHEHTIPLSVIRRTDDQMVQTTDARVLVHIYRHKVAQALIDAAPDQAKLQTLLDALTKDAPLLDPSPIYGQLVTQLKTALTVIEIGEREEDRRRRQAHSFSLALQSGSLMQSQSVGSFMASLLTPAKPEDHGSGPIKAGKIRRTRRVRGLLDGLPLGEGSQPRRLDFQPIDHAADHLSSIGSDEEMPEDAAPTQ